MKPLSSYWASRHHRALGGTTDEAMRLAIALGAIKSVVRVVDRTLPPLSVDWAAIDEDAPVKSMSYTDFKGHAIRVNPMPMKDTSIDHGRALDVCSGFSLHEASHSQESRSRYQYLIKRTMHPNGKSEWEVPAFEPIRVASYLWNLVEDVRIEQVTSRNWPGFAAYFEVMLDYLWGDMSKRHEMPTKFKPDLTAQLRVAYVACRFPAQITAKMRSNKRLLTEIEWWQAWQHDYLTDAVDTPTTIQRGLDHLAEEKKAAEEMAKMKRAEREERQRGERIRAQIDRLMREGIDGTFGVCITEEGEVIPLDAETAEEVRQYVRENLVEHVTVVTGKGVNLAPVHVRKPEESTESRRAYVGKPDPQTEAIRAALVFRPATPQYDEKLLKSGSMDDDELYRWGLGDMRVFSERVIESKPDVFMGLLVDVSGSMYGHKLTTAQRLAQLFVWALHDQEGVETAVWAHTADIGMEPSSEVYRIWQQGDPMSRLGILETLDNSNNRDGQAIEYVASQIALAEQPEKVLVVLSDGIPSGYGYGGEPGMDHVRAVTRWAEARGVRVLQLAIDPHDIRPAEQARMYGEGNWIPFHDYSALPRQLAQVLGRYV